jgi:L-rhamnose mutarotase
MTTWKHLTAGLLLLAAGCAQTEAMIDSTPSGEYSFYELRIYDAAPGKLENLHARFRDHTLRLFEKHGIQNIGYWVPIDNEANQLYFVLGYPDRESRDVLWNAFATDPEWVEARTASEADGRLVTRAQSILLEPTDYSPPVRPEPEGGPRVFEFRRYTASSGNLERLHARFRDHTISLFSRHGIEHFGYWSPVDADHGADDTLIYIMAHRSVEAREASLAAFRADPEWVAARTASEEEAGGSLTVSVEPILMLPTDYSPTK